MERNEKAGNKGVMASSGAIEGDSLAEAEVLGRAGDGDDDDVCWEGGVGLGLGL